jgi:hypothetical protein
MVALMAVASATWTQAGSPVHMVPVRQAESPLGLVIARSTVKTDLVGCDSSIVSAAHTATPADGFSGPCVPAGARSAIGADEAGVHDTHKATDTTGCRRTDTTGVASTACEPAPPTAYGFSGGADGSSGPAGVLGTRAAAQADASSPRREGTAGVLGTRAAAQADASSPRREGTAGVLDTRAAQWADASSPSGEGTSGVLGTRAAARADASPPRREGAVPLFAAAVMSLMMMAMACKYGLQWAVTASLNGLLVLACMASVVLAMVSVLTVAGLLLLVRAGLRRCWCALRRDARAAHVALRRVAHAAHFVLGVLYWLAVFNVPSPVRRWCALRRTTRAAHAALIMLVWTVPLPAVMPWGGSHRCCWPPSRLSAALRSGTTLR